jgi:hypothetical protein
VELVTDLARLGYDAPLARSRLTLGTPEPHHRGTPELEFGFGPIGGRLPHLGGGHAPVGRAPALNRRCNVLA